MIAEVLCDGMLQIFPCSGGALRVVGVQVHGRTGALAESSFQG